MGRQEVAMPSYTFNSPVLDDVIDGVMVSAPINDMVALNLGWLRPVAELNKWGEPHKAHSSIDLAYLSVDVAGDGSRSPPGAWFGFVGSENIEGDFDMAAELLPKTPRPTGPVWAVN